MVSVIIVNYFSADMLKRCFASLQDAHELIVVDNSADVKEQELLSSVAEQESRLRLIFNQKNLGFARAVNQGAAQAEGDLLLILNPDTFLLEDTLALLKAELAKEGVGAVGPFIQFPDGKEQPGARRLTPTPARAFAKLFGLTRLGLMKDHNLAGTELPREPQAVEALSGACMLMRKNLYQELDGMDEAYIMHCEDLDLCMRIRLKGLELRFVPAAKVVHEKGHSSSRQPLWVAWHLHKGMLRYYRKFFRSQYPTVLWFLVVIGVYLRFFVYTSIKLVKRWFEGTSK